MQKANPKERALIPGIKNKSAAPKVNKQSMLEGAMNKAHSGLCKGK